MGEKTPAQLSGISLPVQDADLLVLYRASGPMTKCAASDLKTYINTGAGAGDLLAANNLSDLANITTARANLGLGSAAVLASSAIAQVANNLSEYTAGASTVRTNLGLAIGTDVQAYNAKLAAFAGLTGAADKLAYFTGTSTLATTDLTSAARSLLDDTTVSAMRTTLGLAIGTDVQAYNANLAAVAGLTSAADRLPYFTGSGTAAVTVFTSTARSLLDDASTSAMRTTLGLAIGTDVQAYDTELAALASTTSAANKLPYYTGSGTATTTDLSAFGRTLIDDADAAAARTTLGIGLQLNAVATFSGASGTLLTNSGVSSVSRTNTGRYTINLSSTPTIVGAVFPSAYDTSPVTFAVTSLPGASFTLECKTLGGAYTDPTAVMIMVSA